jgi:hypothetical protein
MTRWLRRTLVGLVSLGGLAALLCLVWRAHAPEVTTIRGIVLDEDGPVSGAVVRVQATDRRTASAADGSFVLDGLAPEVPVTVTAWAAGYYVGWTKACPGAANSAITLKRHYTTDNHDYDWFSLENAEGSRSCGRCMPDHYAEWQADAHARSATNPRFLTMYTGADAQGRPGTPTRYGVSRDYGRFPLRPDPQAPYGGPGYLLDFPDTAGNCAACHVPAASARPGQAYAAPVHRISGIAAEGVFCDFCHKIGEVVLDPATGRPYSHRPGVLSMRLFRPFGEQQLFFGTFDDVTRRVTYLPLQRESAFCAPCHFGVFWDVVVYNSYGEWLESPYSDPRTGKTCQDCHMPPTQATRFARPEEGGLERPPGRIFNHRMPGADNAALLQDTAGLAVKADRQGDRVRVEVRVTNEKAGHHIPTDHPARNILLVVSAADTCGQELPHLGRQVIPDWGGVGSEPNDYAGRPGKGYAKVLEELWTEISPTAAYWRQTVLREDTRIPALATDVTHYEFLAPRAGPVTVRAILIFRRAFKELARQKKWDLRDIPMEEVTVQVP